MKIIMFDILGILAFLLIVISLVALVLSIFNRRMNQKLWIILLTASAVLLVGSYYLDMVFDKEPPIEIDYSGIEPDPTSTPSPTPKAVPTSTPSATPTAVYKTEKAPAATVKPTETKVPETNIQPEESPESPSEPIVSETSSEPSFPETEPITEPEETQ